MSQWYFSTNGKAQGPVSSSDIIENLRARKLTLVDLVFREGETGWCTVGEVPEFREAYNALPLNPPVVPSKPPPLPGLAFAVNDPSARESGVQPFEPGAFQRLISLAESHSLEPLAMPQAGWPHDWRLSTSWIILKKRPDGSGFEQDGPYSAEHIIEMIGAGKVEYAQYCWKPGYTRWFRIGNLPEFDRRKRDRDNDTVNQIVAIPAIREALPALTREELLASVERLRQTRRQSPETAPPETNGRDLIKNAFDVTPAAQPQISIPSIQSVPQFPGFPRPEPSLSAGPVTAAGIGAAAGLASPVPTAQAVTNAVHFPTPVSPIHAPNPSPAPAPQLTQPHAVAAPTEALPKKTPLLKRVMRLGVAGIVAGAAVVGLLEFTAHKDQAREEKIEKTRKPAARPQDVPKHREVEPPPDASATEPAPPAPVAQASAVDDPRLAQNPATTLEIVPIKLNSAPSLTFETDAGVEQVISVRLTAKTGDILRLGSYSNSFEVRRSAGEISTLDLAKLDLPPGSYSVTASAGAAVAVKQIFIGIQGPQFFGSLEHHIKNMSYRQQAERHAVFYGSQKLAALGEALLEKSQTLKRQPRIWKKELGLWRASASEATKPVLFLAQGAKNETAYPDQLAAFQVLAQKLSQVATDFDTNIQQQRDIASTNVDSVVADLRHLTEESALLSGRPSQATP